jgi:5-methylthioadenosine/S-adenosylhomocysteine deaminase
MITLIDGGTVVGFEENGHVLLRDAQVVYEDNRITFVARDYQGTVDQRIDAQGKLVMPGLINHHMAFGIHMQLSRLDKTRKHYFNSGVGLGVQPTDAYAGGGPTAEDWRDSAEYAMITALRTGTTTFVMVPNLGRCPYRGRLGTDQEMVDLVGQTGLRAYLSLPYYFGGPSGTADGRLEWKTREAAGWEGFEQAVEFAETWDGAHDDRIRTMLFPYLADGCSPELLKASKAAAAKLGCTMKIHTAQYLHDYFEMLRRTGKTPIEYLHDADFLGPEVSVAHAVFTPGHPWLGYPKGREDTDVQILAETGASVAHCPVIFAREGVSLNSFSSYMRAGIPVTLGTDTSPHDMIMEMRAASLMSKLNDGSKTSGLASEVFDAATLGGARALQRDDIGRLAPGAMADIVLVDLAKIHVGPVSDDDPVKALIYCANGTDVDTVIVDGVTRLRDGEVLGVDLDDLRMRAERFTERLQASAAHTMYEGRPMSEFYEPAFPDWV